MKQESNQVADWKENQIQALRTKKYNSKKKPSSELLHENGQHDSKWINELETGRAVTLELKRWTKRIKHKNKHLQQTEYRGEVLIYIYWMQSNLLNDTETPEDN